MNHHPRQDGTGPGRRPEDDPSSPPGGRDSASASSGSAASPGAEGSSGPVDSGPADSGDEEALRRLLRGAVDGLEPSQDALERLRHAVPVRRARRRQALVGAVAALVLGGTALPALVHVASTGGADDERATTNTASSRHTERENRADGRSGGVARDGGSPRPQTSGGSPGAKSEPPHTDAGGAQGGSGRPTPSGPPAMTVPDPSVSTFAPVSPTCDRDQLGNGTAAVGPADKDGRVYGAFRVTNVSGSVCTVAGPGTVAATARGGANGTAGAHVPVVDHTSGDAATGLPDPTAGDGKVILRPGQAYEVKFAWIPSGGPGSCSQSGDGGASPAPSPSAAPPAVASGNASSASGSGTASGGEQEQQRPGHQVRPVTDDPKPPPSGSVVLSHTPDGGEPSAADARINETCPGTVYRTGPLPAS
ncbi:hypothetical protein ACFP1Z_25825 [Streptomyces gamaensis]|uniref:DUF4232 domain-containing protein n=1 Tax=Streptomyces gamaensis TaxID=1763542 RepID=A0ABW0ZB18_9ACTN